MWAVEWYDQDGSGFRDECLLYVCQTKEEAEAREAQFQIADDDRYQFPGDFGVYIYELVGWPDAGASPKWYLMRLPDYQQGVPTGGWFNSVEPIRPTGSETWSNRNEIAEASIYARTSAEAIARFEAHFDVTWSD